MFSDASGGYVLGSVVGDGLALVQLNLTLNKVSVLASGLVVGGHLESLE
jgi:hypothetical protein